MKMTTLLLPAWALLSGGALAADVCEPLRQRIEAQIAGSSPGRFSVTVVDADAAVPGKVVGTCALGSRKIVYARSGTEAGTAPAVSPVAKPAAAAVPKRPAVPPAVRVPNDGILTECRDGTVVQGPGQCKL